MAGLYSILCGLIILACYSAAIISQPQPVESPARQNSSEHSASSGISTIYPPIEKLPWNVFAQSGKQICSGMIIHRNWVLTLDSCKFNDVNGSDIVVSAGGETQLTATQVLSARIHQTADLLEGVTLLHLNESLALDKKVQPARIPFVPIGNINYFYGFTSGFANETNTVQLAAFDTSIFTDLCSDSENLCALGIDWPQPDINLTGVDFLGIPYLYADGRHQCVLGARKSQLGNNFTSYYPLLNIIPSIEKHLGLTVKPIPPADPIGQARCGILQ